MNNSFGKILNIEIFGESHSDFIGGILRGFPKNITINDENWKKDMARRAPGNNMLSSARHEDDEVIIKSGIIDGKTTGEAIEFIIPNKDIQSKDYSKFWQIPRPSHADYPAYVRKLFASGGGIFSGRMTAVLVFAGSLAKEILIQKGISIYTHIYRIKDVTDRPFNFIYENKDLLDMLKEKYLAVLDNKVELLMGKCILDAKIQNDSVGGVIETMVLGIPVGIGEPFFDSVESKLSHLLFSIPAVKALEFGDGFNLSLMNGSSANDELYFGVAGNVYTKTNHNGGINGGLTNGMPLIFKVGIKPTPSIAIEQNTVNLVTNENVKIKVQGRHDPCIVPRALPVVESCTALCLLDLLLEREQSCLRQH